MGFLTLKFDIMFIVLSIFGYLQKVCFVLVFMTLCKSFFMSGEPYGETRAWTRNCVLARWRGLLRRWIKERFLNPFSFIKRNQLGKEKKHD